MPVKHHVTVKHTERNNKNGPLAFKICGYTITVIKITAKHYSPNVAS